MSRIDLANIGHSYDGISHAVSGIQQRFEDGGAYALLGPSGCGKTTLLSIVSGLLKPGEGRIELDGRDVTELSIAERNIAQVFQFPVVYESMTVHDNLEFPLLNRKVPAAARKARVDEIIEVLGLADWASQRARSLTPDIKQKISLGRGLVREDVAAVLLDEPLTTVDPALKWDLRRELKALHRRMRRTMVYVTHDQSEALSFAEQVAVMHEGRIVQVGTPRQLFEAAQHTFVGHFIGSPGMNVLPASVEGASAHVGRHRFDLSAAPPDALSGNIEIGIRPEHIEIGREGAAVDITNIEDIGRLRIAHARLDEWEIRIVIDEHTEIPAEPHITLAPERIGLYQDSWRVQLAQE